MWAQDFDLPECDIPLRNERFNLVSETFGFAIAVGKRLPRIALRRQRGDPLALGKNLALELLGPLVRCLEPVLEFGHTSLEFGTGRRGSRGAIACGRGLGPGVFQLVPQGLQAHALFSSFVLAVATQPVELGPQLTSLLGQLYVASDRRREPFAVLLELEAGGIEPLLPDPPLVLGLVSFLAGPLLDLVDPSLELLRASNARPNRDVEAIPVAAERFQFLSPLGEPQPIRFTLPE